MRHSLYWARNMLCLCSLRLVCDDGQPRSSFLVKQRSSPIVLKALDEHCAWRMTLWTWWLDSLFTTCYHLWFLSNWPSIAYNTDMPFKPILLAFLLLEGKLVGPHHFFLHWPWLVSKEAPIGPWYGPIEIRRTPRESCLENPLLSGLKVGAWDWDFGFCVLFGKRSMAFRLRSGAKCCQWAC